MTADPEADLQHSEDPDNDSEGCEAEVMALVVTDEFPTKAEHPQTINQILSDNEDESDAPYLWLADTYSTLPDANPPWVVEGSTTPVNSNWRSSFIGHTVQKVADFIRSAPSPPKPIGKQYCAVLRKEDYERDRILICKIPPEGDDSEPQTIVTGPNALGLFFIGFNRSSWDVTYQVGER